MNAEIDLAAVLAQAQEDAIALSGLLDSETDAMEASRFDAVALLADEKRSRGLRLERGCAILREHRAELPGHGVPEELQAALEQLSAAAQRNMSSLALWRDAGERVLTMVADVVSERDGAIAGYGPAGRKAAAPVQPINLNGVY